MGKERRRLSRAEDDGGSQLIPLDFLYPAVGFVLGLGSPVGALIMRYIHADPYLKQVWFESELKYNMDFYIYMGIGSVAAFMLFGWGIGRRAQRERAHNHELQERVEDLHIKSVTDGLTGIYSHAYLQESLSLEVDRTRRHGHPLSLLILDLDDFKAVNDTHGHLFGDQVLKEVTETISMHVRQEDVFGRYGGEEFLIIMPGAGAEMAARVAERVRKAVARAGVVDETEGGKPVKVTLSIGGAGYEKGATDSARAILRLADANLYRAKRGGKNRVVITAPAPLGRRSRNRRKIERRA